MNIEKLLAVQLINYLNDNKDSVGLPCFITFGTPQSLTGEALWLQMLGGSPYKRYLRGKFKGNFNFAVYYRMSATETEGLEAKLLVPHEQISEWFDSLKTMPIFDGYTITDIEMTKHPTLFRKGEDGEITYQSLWCMNYQN